jgi:multidrug transporter EmrE-like cation transporter
MTAILYLSLCLLADLAVLLADILAKRWVQGNGLFYFFSSFSLYMVATGAWLTFFKFNQHLGRSTVLWCASGIIISVLVGTLYFGEVVSGLNWVGVALCLIGVAFCAIK